MKKTELIAARESIRRIAEREGTSVEQIRGQMKIAMINGLTSENPEIKNYWKSIPKAGEIPTPEELIMFTAKQAKKKMHTSI